MKPEIAAACEKITRLLGVKPKRCHGNVGSMRPYVSVVVPWVETATDHNGKRAEIRAWLQSKLGCNDFFSQTNYDGTWTVDIRLERLG